ncbi:MAG: hypothetical protein RMI74_05360 [Thermodesulfobacterium sp.]|nr:hypothetical protein [Thermodesulfobacterium sp.]
MIKIKFKFKLKMECKMQKIEHLFLVSGESKEEAISKVKHFLKSYELVRYDQFEIKDVLNGIYEGFLKNLEEALQKNQQILEGFIKELIEAGFAKTENFKNLPQGYLSKLFHTIAHFLDGFFGIDSYFYNLVEDSHFLSFSIQEDLKKQPEKYFLILVYGYTLEPLQKFEWLNPQRFLRF